MMFSSRIKCLQILCIIVIIIIVTVIIIIIIDIETFEGMNPYLM